MSQTLWGTFKRQAPTATRQDFDRFLTDVPVKRGHVVLIYIQQGKITIAQIPIPKKEVSNVVGNQ